LGSAPVLLLDDVFSELDPHRSRALLASLPPGQTLLTTALPAPEGVTAAKVYTMAAKGFPTPAPAQSPI
jgi:DNA replication and repair protein RecF